MASDLVTGDIQITYTSKSKVHSGVASMVSARMAGTGIRGGRQSAVFVENTNDAENVEVRLQRRRAESETHGAR